MVYKTIIPNETLISYILSYYDSQMAMVSSIELVPHFYVSPSFMKKSFFNKLHLYKMDEQTYSIYSNPQLTLFPRHYFQLIYLIHQSVVSNSFVP